MDPRDGLKTFEVFSLIPTIGEQAELSFSRRSVALPNPGLANDVYYINKGASSIRHRVATSNIIRGRIVLFTKQRPRKRTPN